jgi:type II secretory pathway predicted ATPase ExeA
VYKEFFGFRRNPFAISPDPKFYFPTPLHNEALASLLYAVKERKGFVVTTGEVGTGKSLLVRCFLEWLTKYRVPFSHIFNTRLSPLEFLQYFAADLGMTIIPNKAELLIQIHHYLIRHYRTGSTAVLVVDEGQLLEWEVLEEIRLLTNLETAEEKLLQIILVGQPELEQKLDSPQLRQLKQRITFRCRLKPLSEEQTQAYISHRLEIAGGNSSARGLFPKRTIAAIAHYSHGIPRLINTLCENALIECYGHQVRTITPEMVAQIAADSRLGSTPHTEFTTDMFDRDLLVKDVFRAIESASSAKAK